MRKERSVKGRGDELPSAGCSGEREISAMIAKVEIENWKLE